MFCAAALEKMPDDYNGFFEPTNAISLVLPQNLALIRKCLAAAGGDGSSCNRVFDCTLARFFKKMNTPKGSGYSKRFWNRGELTHLLSCRRP